MKTKFLSYCLFLTFGLLGISSCSSDSDSGSGNPPPAGSREVKYEVTGTATGNFNVIYFTETGSTTSQSFSTIPWSKTATMQSSVASVGFNATVTGAVAGQTITAKIYVGGVVKREGTSTVQANGGAFVALQPYTF